MNTKDKLEKLKASASEAYEFSLNATRATYNTKEAARALYDDTEIILHLPSKAYTTAAWDAAWVVRSSAQSVYTSAREAYDAANTAKGAAYTAKGTATDAYNAADVNDENKDNNKMSNTLKEIDDAIKSGIQLTNVFLINN